MTSKAKIITGTRGATRINKERIAPGFSGKKRKKIQLSRKKS